MNVAMLGLVIGPMVGAPIFASPIPGRPGLPIFPILGAPVLAQAVGADPRQAAGPSPGDALSVEAVGQCPQREAVMAALSTVVGKSALGPGMNPPRVSDLGDRFEVSAAGQVGQYVDAARDCVERARVAAVFIALALNPPLVRSGETAPGDARDPNLHDPARLQPATETPTPSDRWARLAVGARVDVPSSASGVPGDVAPGVEIRGTLGKGSFGVVAGAGALAPTTTTFGSVAVRQQRFPFGLSVTARRRVSASLEIGADLGASFALVTLRGQNLDTVEPATRLDTGLRLSFDVRIPELVRWLVPFVDVHAEFFPRPYLLDVDPLGDIGKTNRLWLGVSAGVSFESP